METMSVDNLVQELIQEGHNLVDGNAPVFALDETGKIYSIDHVEYEAETNTLWVCTKEF
jgi:hypothetical protein